MKYWTQPHVLVRPTRAGQRKPKPPKRSRGLDAELKRLKCPPRTNETILPVERSGMVWGDRGWTIKEVMRNDASVNGTSRPVEKPPCR